jgi:predicted transglutaminase-like cysteine proteinase
MLTSQSGDGSVKLRSVSLLILGQMIWLTAACTTVSTHRPVDNWSKPAVQADLKRIATRAPADSEASPVDEGRFISRLVERDNVRSSQRASWAEPSATMPPVRRRPAPAMMIGARETAPEGLRDFCRRQPKQCNITVATRALPRRHEDGFMLTGLGPDSSDVAPSRTMMPATGVPIRAFDATREDVAKINQINRQINRAMIGVTDQVAFGRTEFWTMPLTAPEYSSLRTRPLADCEDFALEKRRALIAAGIPESALYLAVAVSPRTSLHAVLVVATVQGDLVLDNLNDWVVGYQETGYTWVKRQSTTSLLDWADAVQSERPNSRLFTNLEIQVPTTRRESEAQSPNFTLATAREATAYGVDLSEPVVLSTRPTGGRSR